MDIGFKLSFFTGIGTTVWQSATKKLSCNQHVNIIRDVDTQRAKTIYG